MELERLAHIFSAEVLCFSHWGLGKLQVGAGLVASRFFCIGRGYFAKVPANLTKCVQSILVQRLDMAYLCLFVIPLHQRLR